ncbi:hypothetical protein LVY74_01615 [Acinetobacter sp. ME22]|uniref:hypothetical protein n=1 Tax=Acinetobacter sp. ME22 TaxID=2904802 RepID=UPI001EDA3C2E|nr:hypothetical protein [Acinetobacter sp. ME22]MCG2572254.1 hypothetical protein [Acinetobacter sp. ME22]
MLKDLKIKLGNHAQFLEACDAFMKLGYQWGSNVPCTAPYLYSHSDGRIFADFFDAEGADLSSPNTAFSYFTNHKNQAVTLEELKIMAYGNSVQMTSQGLDGEPPVPTAVNCGESSGSVGEAKSCLGSASYGNSNHRTIELLLEILRTTNVGGVVTDKARAKLSELVDKI